MAHCGSRKEKVQFVLNLSVLFEFSNSCILVYVEGGRGKEMGDREGRQEGTEVILEVKVWDLFLVVLYTFRKNNKYIA